MVKVKRKKKVTRKVRVADSEQLRGLGGWLILVSASFIFSVIYYFLMIFFERNSMGYLILFINIVMFFFSILVARFYFYEKRKAVLWVIVWFWAGSIASFLNNYILGESVMREVSAYTVIPIIWTFYFMKSVRVKNTFVNK